MATNAAVPARAFRWILPLGIVAAAVALSLDYRANPPGINILVLFVGILAAVLVGLAMWLGATYRLACPACGNRVRSGFNLCPFCGTRLR